VLSSCRLHEAKRHATEEASSGAAKLYTVDARVVPTAGGEPAPSEGIRKMIAALIGEQTRLRPHVTGVVRAGDLALLFTDWTGTAVVKGKTVERFFPAIEVLRRREDDSWRLVIGYPNARPAG